ncbi:MAG: hypothetical protein EA382_13635 [Spirochaetaceae bacterium]|nr:MAG: hypothetical protein EA382_13635 [Spirochaetaceae bacterium]
MPRRDRPDRAMESLVRRLDARAKLLGALRTVPMAVGACTAVSALAGLALLITTLGAPSPVRVEFWRIVALANIGVAVVAALAVALRPVRPLVLLRDADHACHLRSLLVTGYALGEQPTAEADAATGFNESVLRSAVSASRSVDPARVYPVPRTRVTAITALLVVMLVSIAIVDLSRPEPPPPTDGYGTMLADRGRRLAERAGTDQQLVDLAERMQRLGDDLDDGRIGVGEARDRLLEIESAIERQLANIPRAQPFASDGAGLPDGLEADIRAALEAGMSDAEVIDFVARMGRDGSMLPDEVRALEEAGEGVEADAVVGFDEQMRRLIDQLNIARSDDSETGLLNELTESRRVVEQAGAGLAELTEGDDDPIGTSDDSGAGRPVRAGRDDAGAADTDGQAPGGAQGGSAAVLDGRDGSFARLDERSQVLRRIPGVVTEGSIVDLIIRQAPTEAIARLPEVDRMGQYERVVESAMAGESVPQELERIVRDYFLRIAFADVAPRDGNGSEGETNE